MRVLIVDDNHERVPKIVAAMLGARVARDQIVHFPALHDARMYLAEHRVDLLILDILIPNRVEDDPSPDNSARLLTELNEKSALKKPRRIVGLTAYKEEAASVSQAFSRFTWTVLDASDVSDDWLFTLKNCVSYLGAENATLEEDQYQTDLLIVAALNDPEMEAVRRYTWGWSPWEPLDDITFVSKAEVAIGDKTYSAIAAVSERMGMVSTAVLASKLLYHYRPRVCIMPGICAGVPGKTALGDVIFAELAWDYQSGKFRVDDESVSGFDIDPHHINVDVSVAPRIRTLASDSAFFARVLSEWGTRLPLPAPRLLSGPVGTGSAVLADAEVTRNVVKQQRKVRGIEMELYGLYAAATYGPKPRPIFFGLKAVCDFADESKNDSYQEYASYVSARVLRELVERSLPDWVNLVD